MNEAPSHDNTFGPIAMGDEIWTLFNHDGAGLASKSGCPENYQPTLSELQKLYSDYPGGQIGEWFGWPIALIFLGGFPTEWARITRPSILPAAM